jgi:hypothetical protein
MRRPVTLTIAVVLQWIAAFVMLLSGLDLFMSALRISTAKTELALENAEKLNGITDVSGPQIVAGVMTAGIFLVAIAIVRVILALYLGRGRNWARLVITVLVLLNALSAIAYLFQEEFWRGLPPLALEAVILWLMFNRSSSEYIAQHSNPAKVGQTV